MHHHDHDSICICMIMMIMIIILSWCSYYEIRVISEIGKHEVLNLDPMLGSNILFCPLAERSSSHWILQNKSLGHVGHCWRRDQGPLCPSHAPRIQNQASPWRSIRMVKNPNCRWRPDLWCRLSRHACVNRLFCHCVLLPQASCAFLMETNTICRST